MRRESWLQVHIHFIVVFLDYKIFELVLPKSTLEKWRLQRELFSLFHTSQSHFTNQGNYKLSWSWNWQTDVPLNAWHSTSISRKGEWKKKKKKVFSAGSMIEMLEFFPKAEIQIHNSTLFACFSKLDFQPWRLSRSASCQNMTYTTGTETSTCERQTMTIKIFSPWVGPKKREKAVSLRLCQEKATDELALQPWPESSLTGTWNS